MSDIESLSDSEWLDLDLLSSASGDNDDGLSDGDSELMNARSPSRSSSTCIEDSDSSDIEAWEGLIDSSATETQLGGVDQVSPHPIAFQCKHTDIGPSPSTCGAKDAAIIGTLAISRSGMDGEGDDERIRHGLDQSMVSTLSSSRSSWASSGTTTSRDLRLSFPDPLTSSKEFEQVQMPLDHGPNDVIQSDSNKPTSIATEDSTISSGGIYLNSTEPFEPSSDDDSDDQVAELSLNGQLNDTHADAMLNQAHALVNIIKDQLQAVHGMAIMAILSMVLAFVVNASLKTPVLTAAPVPLPTLSSTSVNLWHKMRSFPISLPINVTLPPNTGSTAMKDIIISSSMKDLALALFNSPAAISTTSCAVPSVTSADRKGKGRAVEDDSAALTWESSASTDLIIIPLTLPSSSHPLYATATSAVVPPAETLNTQGASVHTALTALRQAHDAMVDLLRQDTSDLNAALDELGGAITSQIISIASTTPLSSSVQTVKDGLGSLPGKLKARHAHARKQARALKRKIGGMDAREKLVRARSTAREMRDRWEQKGQELWSSHLSARAHH